MTIMSSFRGRTMLSNVASSSTVSINNNFNTINDPYWGYVKYMDNLASGNNNIGSVWSAPNGTSLPTFPSAPSGCPNSTAMYITQGYGLYSTNGFGSGYMPNLSQSFTFEWWGYVNSYSATYGSWGGIGSFSYIRGDGGDPISGQMYSNGSIDLGGNSTTSSLVGAAGTIPYRQWFHFAIVNNRTTSTKKIFINGNQVASDSNPWTGNAASYEWGDGHDFNMGYDIYVSNIRLTQYPRYTSNFTASFINFPNK